MIEAKQAAFNFYTKRFLDKDARFNLILHFVKHAFKRDHNVKTITYLIRSIERAQNVRSWNYIINALLKFKIKLKNIHV